MEQNTFLVFKRMQMNQNIKHILSQQLLRCNYGLQELVILAPFNKKYNSASDSKMKTSIQE